MQDKAQKLGQNLIWYGLVLMSFGSLWILKFTIQRAVQDGINGVK